MARYHGKGGAVYVGASEVVGLSKWSIDATTDKVDVSAFGDGNKVYVQGLEDLKGSLSGFWDDVASDTLYTAAASATPSVLILYPNLANKPTKYWTGQAWLDYQVSAAVNAAVETSCNFVAAGTWTRA